MPGLDGQYFDAQLHHILDEDGDLGLVHFQHELIPPAFAQKGLPLGMAELFRRKSGIARIHLDDGPGWIEQFVRTSFNDLFSFIDDEHSAGDEFHLTEQMGGNEHGLFPVAAQVEDQVADIGYPLGIQSVGRFVEDDKVRVMDECSGNA